MRRWFELIFKTAVYWINPPGKTLFNKALGQLQTKKAFWLYNVVIPWPGLINLSYIGTIIQAINVSLTAFDTCQGSLKYKWSRFKDE
jgi:hypothetical protein